MKEKVCGELNGGLGMGGDVGVVWEGEKEESGWGRWVGWGDVEGEEMIVGNGGDIGEVRMVDLGGVEGRVGGVGVVRKRVWVGWMKVEKGEGGVIGVWEKKNKWRFNVGKDDKKEGNGKGWGWWFGVDNIVLDEGGMRIDEKVRKGDVEIFVDGLGKGVGLREVSGWKGKGDKEKVGD